MVVELMIKWAVPAVLSGVIAYVVAIYKKSSKRIDAVGTGVQALLRAEIIRSHKEYTKKGYMPVYAKEAIERTYEAYHNLGGNDVATGLYREMMNLPTEERNNE